MIHFKNTDYGFEWGAATIERRFSDKKREWVVLGITTPRDALQVYVTKTGKVRVFSNRLGGVELVPKKRVEVGS